MASLSGMGCPSHGGPCWVTPTSLLVILAKYGLDGRKDARMVTSNFLSDGAKEDSLGDPRLEKLWHKVPLGACTHLELVSSRQELRGLSRSLCSAGGSHQGSGFFMNRTPSSCGRCLSPVRSTHPLSKGILFGVPAIRTSGTRTCLIPCS